MKLTSPLLIAALICAPVIASASGNGTGQPGAQFLIEWDRSGTGSVSLGDMQTRRAEIFEMFDLNGDGVIDADEAANMAQTVAGKEENKGRADAKPGKGQAQGGMGPGRVIHDAMSFAFNDSNGDGVITKDEFVAATVQVFAALDRNRDGALTMADFGR